MSSSSPRWFGILPFLCSDVEQLPVGDFLSSSNSRFSLFDSMSALELMEPRMDPVMKAIKLTEKTKIPETFEENSSLNSMRADLLLALHAKHLNGQTLPNSLMSSKLFHYEKNDENNFPYNSITDPVLRITALLTLHCSLCCRSLISCGDLYEEDEWSAHQFGVLIDERCGGVELLAEAEKIIFSMEENSSIRKKLNFLFFWLKFLTELENNPKSFNIAAEIFQSLSKSWMELICSDEWLSADYETKFSSFVSDPSQSLVDPGISAWLVLHAPPRLMTEINLSETREIFHKLFSDLSLVMAINNLNNFNELFSLVEILQNREATILARSVIVNALRNEEFLIGEKKKTFSSLIEEFINNNHSTILIFSHPPIISRSFSSVPVSPVLPLPSLISDWKLFYKLFLLQTFEFFLSHRYKCRRRLNAVFNTMKTLWHDSENVDRWLQHVCQINNISHSENNSSMRSFNRNFIKYNFSLITSRIIFSS